MMAIFYFQKCEGVIDSPLSWIKWEDPDLSFNFEKEMQVLFALNEYLIICGDLGCASRDEKLKELRDEIEQAGHSVVVEDGLYPIDGTINCQVALVNLIESTRT
jgi:hypothetical protein